MASPQLIGAEAVTRDCWFPYITDDKKEDIKRDSFLACEVSYSLGMHVCVWPSCPTSSLLPHSQLSRESVVLRPFLAIATNLPFCLGTPLLLIPGGLPFFLCFSKCCPWTSSISITWKLVRKEGFQVPPQPYGTRICSLTRHTGDSNAYWSLRSTALFYLKPGWMSWQVT